MQILLTAEDGAAKIEGVKVQSIAKFVGISLTVKAANAEELQLTLPCLLANGQHVSGGNVIAKLLVAAAGHTLYPQAPYSLDKRYRAAQIDELIDYSTIELRNKQVTTRQSSRKQKPLYHPMLRRLHSVQSDSILINLAASKYVAC